jgi:hypothetical protein
MHSPSIANGGSDDAEFSHHKQIQENPERKRSNLARFIDRIGPMPQCYTDLRVSIHYFTTIF